MVLITLVTVVVVVNRFSAVDVNIISNSAGRGEITCLSSLNLGIGRATMSIGGAHVPRGLSKVCRRCGRVRGSRNFGLSGFGNGSTARCDCSLSSGRGVAMGVLIISGGVVTKSVASGSGNGVGTLMGRG